MQLHDVTHRCCPPHRHHHSALSCNNSSSSSSSSSSCSSIVAPAVCDASSVSIADCAADRTAAAAAATGC
eukprot:6377-Heterococcus_DN1.PRE.3